MEMLLEAFPCRGDTPCVSNDFYLVYERLANEASDFATITKGALLSKEKNIDRLKNLLKQQCCQAIV